MKGLNKNGDWFKYICQSFLGLSAEKLKTGIFDGTQIRIIMNNKDFITHMTQVVLEAWASFISIVMNFLGNHKAKNYSEIVDKIL